MANNPPLFVEVIDYLKDRKAWWLIPLIILLALAGLLIIFGQSSAISPFIYTLG